MKKSKITLSFCIGCIALSVAGLSMSLAWYAAANRLQVSSIDITIDCDRELFISTSPDGGFVEELSYNDLNHSGDFLPLTSAHSSTWLNNKSDTPVFFDETRYSSYEFAELYSPVNRGYYSQKFYLKSDDDVYVTLDYEKTFLNENSEYNKSYAERLYDEYQAGDDNRLKNLSKDEIETRLNRLIKAMRFSILVNDADDYSYTIIDPNKNDETYYGGLLDNDIDDYYDYYTKESDGLAYERVYGEIIGDKANIAYDDALTEDSLLKDVNEEPNAFNAAHKKDVKRFNLEKTLENGVEIKKEEALDLEEFANNVKPYHFPVHRNTPQEIVVSIYIEGWDLDSVNYTMGATFLSSLSFMIEREM